MGREATVVPRWTHRLLSGVKKTVSTYNLIPSDSLKSANIERLTPEQWLGNLLSTIAAIGAW